MPTADLGEVNLHYCIDGDQALPVLVLAHSLGTDLSMWNKVVPALARRYRVLRYDMRGHGQSSIAGDFCTIEDLASDLMRLLDHLEVNRIHFCGLSLGGLLGIWCAIHSRERMDRIILANTDARLRTREAWEERIGTVRREGMTELARVSMGRWFTPQYLAENAAEVDALRARAAGCSPDGYIACCAVLRDTDLREGLDRISAPCLVLAGQFDEATPAADGRVLHQAIRGSRFVELPCSHLSAWERPEDFQEAVLDFLDRREGM